MLTRLAEWVSENPRHQGFATKPLPELDCLASLGVDTLQGHLTGMPTSAPGDWSNWGNSAPTASSR